MADTTRRTDSTTAEHHGKVVVDQRDLCGSHPAYEAPRIESVLSAADLEREILYAGGGSALA